MSVVKWKQDKAPEKRNVATAGSLGQGNMGGVEVSLYTRGKKIVAYVGSTPVLEWTENDGDILTPKFIKGSEMTLAEAFNQFREI